MATNMPKVKSERPDEAEIAELAAKMREANKQKAEQAALKTNVPQNNNPISANKSRKQEMHTKEKEEKAVPCDEESQRGRFGWVTLGKIYHVPYLFRSGEKYCAVRMVESKLLKKYLSYLHSDIYTCTCIRSYYITESEARLLNEINFKHCESQFGKEQFTSKDLVVRLIDTAQFYDFLDSCYNKLLSNVSSPKDRCGFVRINRESVVPYTVKDNRKFVPLFYFEGETDSLKLKAVSLDGWDLAYLKFCCKVQGIRNELFASETCLVISLADIKSYFPPGTYFELYWPVKVLEQPLLLPSHKMGMSHASGGLWTRQPSVPPPSTSQSDSMPMTRRPSTSSINASASRSSANTLPSTNGWNNGFPPTSAPSLPVVSQQNSSVIRMAPHYSNYQTSRSAPMTNQSIPAHHNPNRMPYPGHLRPNAPVPNSIQALQNRVRRPPASAPGAPQYYGQMCSPNDPTIIAAAVAMQNNISRPVCHAAPPPLVRVSTAMPQPPAHIRPTQSYRPSNMTMPSTAPIPHIMPVRGPSGNATITGERPMLPPQAIIYSQQRQSQKQQPQATASQHQQQQQQQQSQQVKYQQPAPPPLIPVNGTPSLYSNSPVNNSIGWVGSDIIDLSSPPPSPRQTIPPNGEIRKLIQIADTATSGPHIPYQIQKVLVNGKMVPSVNLKPFTYTKLLMTLHDFIQQFFPQVSMSSCRQVLQDVLGVELYRGNHQQMQVLKENGKCNSVTEVVPLVQVKDVIKYMPQMEYMFSRLREDNTAMQLAKRQRTS